MRPAAPRSRPWLWVALLTTLLGGCAALPGLDTVPRRPIQTLAVDSAEARRLVSDYRRAHGQGEVALDPALGRVAQRQADAMAAADDLSHTVDGELPNRLLAAGEDRSAAVENVSAGYGSLASALSGWRRSPAHNANLLFRPVRRMGIAAAIAPGTRFRTFWALVMTD